VIVVERLVKTFPMDRQHSTAFRALRHWLGRGRRFVALDGVDVEVGRGDSVGIIGDNGAGKTTLLKIAAGLVRPTSGRVTLGGSVTLLSGLGIGMHGELTVTDNIRLYGAIYGVDRATTRANMGEIIAWAELQEFDGAKLKHLSAGMRTRLAFSALRHIDTDIYLLDEVLTAGDKNFAEKCDEAFRAFQRAGKTLLVATHDRRFVETFCNKVLWLHKGRPMAFGDTAPIVARYYGGGAG
jgi:ABC-type polysaccharide/polyol phosphate transport system ATPase subunit